MAITLKNLINIAPFPEEQKKALIANMNKMTEDDKYELSNASWSALAVMYYGRLDAGRKLIMDEVLEGKRKMNQNDFEELEARLIHEFAQKLESAEDQGSIEEVRKQLEKYPPDRQAGKTQPLSQRHKPA